MPTENPLPQVLSEVTQFATNLMQGIGSGLQQHPAHSGQGPNLVSLNHDANLASADPISDSTNQNAASPNLVNVQLNGPTSVNISVHSIPMDAAGGNEMISSLLSGIGG